MTRMRRPGPAVALTIAFVLVAAVYPLARLLLVPLWPALAPAQMAGARAAVSMAAIGNSMRIGAEAGVAAIVPGFAMAYVLERAEWAGARVLTGCLWLLLLTPSYLLSAGWQVFVSAPPFADGPLYHALFSEAGIVALLALKGLPFACLAGRTCWAGVGGEIGAALRIHVRSRTRRWAILLRLMAPAIGAVFAVVFIEGIADFGVAATLGAHLHLPLVIYGIYAALARTPIDFRQAALLSLVLIAIASLAVALHQRLGARAQAGSGRSRPALRHRPGRAGAAGATLGTALLIGAAFVVPGGALAARALGSGEPSRLGAADAFCLVYSTCYAFAAATFATALAVLLLGIGRQRHPVLARLLDALTIGSMAVPAIVLGAAYVVAFNGALPLYGTPALLLIGFVATHLPMLARFLQTPLHSAHANLTDAAALHGLRRRARAELVHAPLLLRPLLWGWSLAFAGIFFELPLSSLLYPIGRAPLGVQLLLLDETLRFADEARLAMAGIATCLVVVGLVAWALPWWLARTPRPHAIGRRIAA